MWSCVYTHNTMNLPGFEGLIITNQEMVEGYFRIDVECPREEHVCPGCGDLTDRIHDYRIQRIQHLKVFERRTEVFYRKRRYVCVSCGKRFYEQNNLVDRYQRHTKEWNQALGLRVIQGKTFKETAELYHTSTNTVMRRFDKLANKELKEVKELPEIIAIDEYKGDTDEGKYQLIIADGKTREPIDILPNRSKKTITDYLQSKGANVQVVIMDMSYAFKAAVRKALDKPVIIADRFHFCRYIYWALERVRIQEQSKFSDYDRKKCKKMRHVFYKHYEDLTEKQKWYLERYLNLSDRLRIAYQLKELYRDWFKLAKATGKTDMETVKANLREYYKQVYSTDLTEFHKAIETFQNWQPEILNSFAYDYSNGFLEGINNLTKVIKRNAFGFRSYKRFRHRILLHHKFKYIGYQIG